MATEAVVSVNGNYGAASHSSQSTSAANGTGSETTPMPQTGKDEVGWFFVEQYYTTMSRSPEKVHLFYNKRSQFVYGVEAEKVPVSVGQKAINERIAELGIEDCKVRVTNVDSQESGKCIVLQVIGEMSVKGQPHRKFAQCFVLAEQPNGYFVLNDIFRYIADEPDEDEELEPASDAPAAAPAETEQIKTLTSSDNLVEQARDAEIVDKKLEEAELAEEPTVEAASVQDADVTEADSVDESAADVAEVDVKSTSAAALEPEKPKEPEPTPSATPSPAAQAPPAKETPAPPAAAAAPAPAPSKPAAPKTWASMLASNKNAIVVPAIPAVPAQPSISQTQAKQAAAAVPAPATATAKPAGPPVSQAPANDAEVPASPGGWQTAGSDHSKKQTRPPTNVNVSGYIKNVSEKFFDNASLRQHLSQFGKISYFDISRPKNCAFVEFDSPAGYNAAVAANPHSILGEEIIVEERRRPNIAGNSFRGGPRGGRGGPGGRGGFTPRGRGGPAGRGRGGAPEA